MSARRPEPDPLPVPLPGAVPAGYVLSPTTATLACVVMILSLAVAFSAGVAVGKFAL